MRFREIKNNNNGKSGKSTLRSLLEELKERDNTMKIKHIVRTL